jgi:hypothetical protein
LLNKILFRALQSQVFTLKMEAENSSEMFVSCHISTQHHNQKTTLWSLINLQYHGVAFSKVFIPYSPVLLQVLNEDDLDTQMKFCEWYLICMRPIQSSSKMSYGLTNYIGRN